MAPIQLINEASPIIAGIGGAFYFDEATVYRGKALGLDGFRFYMLGRCGVLGDVEAEVVERKNMVSKCVSAATRGANLML